MSDSDSDDNPDSDEEEDDEVEEGEEEEYDDNDEGEEGDDSPPNEEKEGGEGEGEEGQSGGGGLGPLLPLPVNIAGNSAGALRHAANLRSNLKKKLAKKKFGGRTSKAAQVTIHQKVAIIMDWKRNGCKKSNRELERDHGVSHVSCGKYIRERQKILDQAEQMSKYCRVV